MKSLVLLLVTVIADSEQSRSIAPQAPPSAGIPADAQERDCAFASIGEISKGREYFVDGKKVGERLFYASGKLAEEKLFHDGRLDGVWHQYYANGRIFAERPYTNGMPAGNFVFYDDNGNRLGMSAIRSGNGLLRECENKTFGTRNAAVPYVNGHIHGQEVVWGEIEGSDLRGRVVTEFKHGAREGWQVAFRDDGSIYSTAYYHDDKAHGVQRKFEGGGVMAMDYPKYFIRDEQVDQAKYEETAKQDPSLRISLEHEVPGKSPRARIN